ncbi:E3 CR1-alpha0 [Human adenovirus 7]|uniref:E3 CR1-alpha0 n=2 Tax=Human mastadenovirus B TaxID=108098 RepID=A0A5J6CTK3_ADE07|nr:E3 CR1-alpha [Human mastadenovirus B]QEQ50122.1 E3 CR1-alpha0 [Human adenovirus 7]QEQ50159.1 E3 CR1-alpha0 [Human adenovirus 7]
MKAFAVLFVLSLIKTELRPFYGLPLLQSGLYNTNQIFQKTQTLPPLIQDSNSTLPAPSTTNLPETNKLGSHLQHRLSRSLLSANTTTPKTGGELRGLPTDDPWVVAGFVTLGVVAGGLVLILCYLYIPCCAYLVILRCWFKKWGPY